MRHCDGTALYYSVTVQHYGDTMNECDSVMQRYDVTTQYFDGTTASSQL